ncbi:Voltage-gated Ion Channel (VIC) Superfamily [Phytophthora cinnamomi]|uniref:Voltage-gated Ion Channel (VIC) Superfamily n=1 Tax=Phytophthora cinnamomi TaxID=4785 RepID=UPI00355A475C|nr:Voltage-gated Ion Channel (VIC) Superfamily [Phytophthora cinnamomi]
MSDASEIASPSSSDDERLVNVFRDSLRDGKVCAKLHGARGEPANGDLKLLEDKVTLVWQPKAMPLQSYMPPSVVAKLVMNGVSVMITDAKSVRTGRQTTNFVRTIKYLTTDELPESDDRCLSLCFAPQPAPPPPALSATAETATLTDAAASGSPSEEPQPSTAGTIETFDLEFEDEHTRDIARAFFRQQAGLERSHESEEPETFSDIQIPSGLSTRCYQIVAHPSFELAVLVAVVGSMISVGWRSFRYVTNIKDDDEIAEVARFGMTILEYLLLVFLTIEQTCKAIGLEGIMPLLRSKWDAFDLFAVTISWLAVLPFSSLAGFNLLSLRVFRGMRIFKRWKSFQETMETFLVSLPMAGNAVLCYCYYLFLFAILGMYLFNDSLSHRCAIQADSDSFIAPMSAGETKTYVAENPVHFCRIDDPATVCKSNMECVAMSPPDRGYTGFHSFEASFLTVFLITMRSGFGPSLDGAQQVSSYFSIIYFIGLVVFVSYMILSLFVGIVRGSYITVSIVRAAKHAEQEKRMEKYLTKSRVQFPKGTEAFPDVMQVVDAQWQVYRARFKEWLLQSPLFTRSDGTFLSWCRLRQERIFFLIEPGSATMDRISSIAESLAFEHLMNLVVFFNSVLFALEYHGMSESYAARLYLIENFLMLVYGTEFIIIGAAAGGLFSYLQNPWNRLDFVLLVIACVEFLLLTCSVLLYTDSYARGIFVLRLFRLVRPFRVVRQNNKLLLVLDAILSSVPAFLSSIAFHILLNSVFAVVGMNLFGGNFPLTMQSHFNTFSDSMLTLFKFSNGGSIWPIFHASLQASSFWVALLYYLTYVVLCRFIALNFMLVVLLRNFAMKGDERRKTLSELFQDRMFAMQRIHLFDMYTFVEEFSNLYQGDVMNVSLPGSAKKRAQRALSASEAFKARLFNVLPTSDFLKLKGYYGTTKIQQDRKYIQLEPPTPANGKHKNQATVTPIEDSTVSVTAHAAASAVIVPTSGPESPTDIQASDEWTGWTSSGGATGYVRQFFDGHWLMADVSLFLFPPQSWVRLKARRLEKETEKYIFAAIVIRTVMLTVQSPLYSSLIQELTTLSDVVYAFVLFFEFALKVISRGFIFTPKSYLSDTWNQINMVVLMACSLLLLLPHSTMISLFRLGRAFGPIRVFYRVRTFRVITEALEQSATPLFYCVVLSIFLFYSFATLGMQIFGGRFAYCSDPSIDTEDKCVGVFWNSATGILTPRVWGNLSGLHFDNITGAMSSILFLVSMKGWLPIVNIAMDFADDSDVNNEHQASAIASTYFAGFFVAFLFFTRFYLLKIFAGILMNNFRCYNGTLLLTNLQLIWLRKKQAIVAMRPKYPLPTKRSRALRTLFRTLLASVQLTLKVTLLLGYVLFVFAIVGVQVFSLTRWASGLNSNLNLTTFPMAYSAFVKFAAGEDCDCGSPTISALFYNIFYVLVVLILQNLYASTMVDTYVLMSARVDDKGQLLGFQATHLQRFQVTWSDFDTDALGLLHRKHLLALLTKLEPPLGLGTHRAMVESLRNEDMKAEELAALSIAVHRRRRETFHDIEARIAELTYRVRLGLGSYDGLNGSANASINPDQLCPPNMFRFTDLLLVLTMRVLPLESLTVQEKVDELAMRGYAFRHRKTILIQSAFRMFRVRRRMTSRIRKAKRESEIKRLESETMKAKTASGAQPKELPKPAESDHENRRTRSSLSLNLPSLALPACMQLRTATSERLRAPASVAPILSEHLELQPEASDGRKCSI